MSEELFQTNDNRIAEMAIRMIKDTTEELNRGEMFGMLNMVAMTMLMAGFTAHMEASHESKLLIGVHGNWKVTLNLDDGDTVLTEYHSGQEVRSLHVGYGDTSVFIERTLERLAEVIYTVCENDSVKLNGFFEGEFVHH